MQPEIFVRFVMLADHEGKLLLCKNLKRGFYFLPGTIISFGQSAEKTLSEYIMKICKAKTKKLYYLGTTENIFKGNNKLHHQYNVVFKLEDKMECLQLPQDEVDYKWEWVDIKKEPSKSFRPEFLKEDLYRWLKGEDVFFSSNKKIHHD